MRPIDCGGAVWHGERVMHITMNDTNVESITQLREIIKLTKQVEFQSKSKDETYEWMGKILSRFKYSRHRTSKKDRGIILSYITQMTGLSRSHVKALARRKKKVGKLVRIIDTRNSFPKVYDTDDVARLIETDNAHGRLSGWATKQILRREYEVYGKTKYEQIRHISVSHIYNLRETRQYTSHVLFIKKTKSVSTPIGMRRKPKNDGKPGYIRVDSVHQGDLDKQKGVYHINLVDEVTQWEILGCVEGISEYFLIPLLEELLELFPFNIINFHSDNGGEYINYKVSEILNKIKADQTKSRSRRTNDNALVEGKNAAVIRKHMGHAHIPRKHAKSINQFYRDHMDEYLNYHRPCGYATDKVDARGKIVKKYDLYMPPYMKLISIPEVEKYLRTSVTLEKLKEIASKQSDNECATKMQEAKKKLFETLRKC
jgi:predicted DNA-binding transcriptional regulator AlpA